MAMVKRMNNTGNRVLGMILLAIGIFAASGLLLSCEILPSPLYGTWADNEGNKLSLSTDSTFSAAIIDPVKGLINYDGDYSVLLNSLVLSCSTGKQIVSEWDIRGNMLYLNWTSEEGLLILLTLYKTAN